MKVDRPANGEIVHKKYKKPFCFFFCLALTSYTIKRGSMDMSHIVEVYINNTNVEPILLHLHANIY